MNEQLSKDYVVELIKATLSSNKILEMCRDHLKYEFLQTEAQKRVVKFILETYALGGQSPTLGIIAQAFPTHTEVVALLSKIKITDIKGKEDTITTQFEVFIKDLRYQAILKKSVELYNNNKQDEAVKIMAKEATAIAEFSLRPKAYTKVFSQFDDRMKKRQLQAASDQFASTRERLTTGIHEFDSMLGGGYRKGTSFLAMARSGIGKTTYLRWTAITNARLGKRVVLFQNEDTEENAMESMDAAWTGITGGDIEDGMMSEELQALVIKVKEEILRRGGEIILVATDKFNDTTIEWCDEQLDEIEKVEGKVDMALWDYLEVFTSKGMNGKSEGAERRRREDVANRIVSIAVKRNIVTGTATQAADIPIEKINNPDFNMTRTHASEFKGVVKPFAYFFTFNATDDEYQQQIVRVHIDKLRKSKGAGRTIKLYQSRENGRFYDAVRTKQTWDSYNHAA